MRLTDVWMADSSSWKHIRMLLLESWNGILRGIFPHQYPTYYMDWVKIGYYAGEWSCWLVSCYFNIAEGVNPHPGSPWTKLRKDNAEWVLNYLLTDMVCSSLWYQPHTFTLATFLFGSQCNQGTPPITAILSSFKEEEPSRMTLTKTQQNVMELRTILISSAISLYWPCTNWMLLPLCRPVRILR